MNTPHPLPTRTARLLAASLVAAGVSAVPAVAMAVTRNRAIANQGIGIAAPAGTIDGGRNKATRNLGGNCTGVVCL